LSHCGKQCERKEENKKALNGHVFYCFKALFRSYRTLSKIELPKIHNPVLKTHKDTVPAAIHRQVSPPAALSIADSAIKQAPNPIITKPKGACISQFLKCLSIADVLVRKQF